MVTVIVGDSMFHEGDWRARQEQDPFRATLRDQIDDNTNAAAVNALLIKLQNVTAERDRLVDENKQVTIDYGIAVKSHNRQQEAHVACKNEVDRLVSQLAAVTAERDEARAELAAIAHLRKRPEGLPTAEELGWLGINVYGKTGCYTEMADAILALLAPYLRDPVGWELDVTAQAIRNAWLDAEAGGGSWDAAEAILDLCRSRIRPVMECKECADKERRVHRLEGWVGALEGYCDDMRKLAAQLPARAALEGE